MKTRTFRIAPSLARLAAREAGAQAREDGFHDTDRTRNAHVSVSGGEAYLWMDGREPVEIPDVHARAILEAAPRRLSRERTTLDCEGRVARVDRYLDLGVDLVEVSFPEPADAEAFVPPPWLGAEVTSDPAYAPHSLAWDGAPAGDAVAPSDAGLSGLLDLVERIPQPLAA